jgi:hypothetical protein
MIIVAAICIFSITVYAEENCETRYLELLDRVKSSVELSDTDKAEYISPLQKALQLCMEGKTEQAREIVQELRGEANRGSGSPTGPRRHSGSRALLGMGSRERLAGSVRAFGSITGAHGGLRTRESSGRGADALGDPLPIHHLARKTKIVIKPMRIRN